MRFLLLIAFAGILLVAAAIQCGPNKYNCLNSELYQLCVNNNNSGLLVGVIHACPPTTSCDENSCSFPCLEKPPITTTTTTTTTTSSTTTTTKPPTTTTTTPTTTTSRTTTTTNLPTTPAPPECTANGKLPASQCNQYYECSWWVFWYDRSLKTCDPGKAFNATALQCTDAGPLGCTL